MAQIINLGQVRGSDGVGISAVEQTAASTESGGLNVVRVTLTDDTAYEFQVRNGAKGATGATGAAGAKGATGATGATGPAGPNAVSTATTSSITGLLKGSGGKVAAAVKNTDYLAPPAAAAALPASGTALTANTIYTVSAAVGTYKFNPPASGWACGTFTTGTSVAITFSSGTFIGAKPTFSASTKYEFNVLNGIWAFAKVVAS